MRIILLFISIIVFSKAFAQIDTNNNFAKTDRDTSYCWSVFDSIQNRDVFWIVDEMPTFGDTITDLNRYIYTNLEYPIYADVEGNVYLQIVVEPDGKVSNIKVMRGIDPLLDKNALKVIKNMPLWKPGSCKGKKVPVTLLIPIRYKLN